MQKNIKNLLTFNNLGLSQIFLSPFSMPKTDYWCADDNNTKVTIFIFLSVHFVHLLYVDIS